MATQTPTARRSRARHAVDEKGSRSVKSGKPKAICGATLRSGKKCQRAAGYGTSHSGRGRCRDHGGSSPDHRTRALREEAHAEFGAWADIDPVEAITFLIRIAAGEVAYFNARCQELERDQILVRDETRTHGYNSDGDIDFRVRSRKSELHILIQARREAMDRLFRYSKDAISLGLEERKVRMAEQWGEVMGGVLRGVLADLDLTEAQAAKAPEIVRSHLMAMSQDGSL